MKLEDAVASLAGSRCSCFTWNSRGSLTTFTIEGPTSAMHDLLTRCGGVTGARLIGRQVEELTGGEIRIILDYATIPAVTR